MSEARWLEARWLNGCDECRFRPAVVVVEFVQRLCGDCFHKISEKRIRAERLAKMGKRRRVA